MPQLTNGTTIGYALGQLGAQMGRDVPASLLLFFMTQHLGVAPALAGTAILMPKLWVVVGDLLVGVASDRTQSRWGRRRPYLLVGALLTSLGFVWLFHVSASSSPTITAIYVACVYLLLSTGLSLFGVPYLAMASELTPDAAERTRVLSFRQVGLLTGVFIGLAGAPLIIQHYGGGLQGYRVMSIAIGLALALSMLAPWLATKRVTLLGTAPSANVWGDLRGALTNRAFMLVIATNIAQCVSSGASAAAALYFVTLTLGFDFSVFSEFIIYCMVAAVLSPPFWVYLAGRVGRPTAYLVAIGAHIVTLLLYFFLSPGDKWPLIVLGMFGGVANAGISLLAVSLLTDVVEADTAASGGRGALLSSFYTMTEKVSVALGAFAVAGVLSVGGFIESRGTPVAQTPEALEAARFAYVGVAAATQLMTFAFAWYLRRVLKSVRHRSGLGMRPLQ